jgi:hypothetical protein
MAAAAAAPLLLLLLLLASVAAEEPGPPTTPPPCPAPPLPVDSWADKYYRNWTYYSDWAIPPSCLDPSTCGRVKRNFTDIAQAWRVPGDSQWSMTYTFFDGEGYQTALAHSSDLLKWDQSPGTVFSPRADRAPLEWTALPGDFDYGGAGTCLTLPLHPCLSLSFSVSLSGTLPLRLCLPPPVPVCLPLSVCLCVGMSGPSLELRHRRAPSRHPPQPSWAHS